MMKNLRPFAVIILLVLAAVLAGMTRYTGYRVSQEVELLARTLMERDDLGVARLDYERGFFAGTLHYDLSWQPKHDDEAVEALREAGLVLEDGFRIAGTLHVRHGPWVGWATGLAMASGEADIALPDAWLPVLQQYPHQAPMLRVAAILSYGGRLEARLSAVDYHGPVDVPDSDSSIDLGLSGLQGVLATNSRLDRVCLELRLEELSVTIREADAAVAIDLGRLFIEADATESLPYIWTGTSRIGVGRFAMVLPANRFETYDLLAESDTWIEGDALSYRGVLAAGETRLDGYNLLGGTLVTSLRNIDVAALARIAEQAERSRGEVEGQDPEEGLEELQRSLAQIFAGGPSLAFDRFSLSLAAPEDLSGHVSLELAAGAQLAPDTMEGLAHALRMEADLKLSKDALRYLAGLVAANQTAPGIEPDASAMADTMYQEALENFRALPFVTVTDEHIAASAQLSQGRLLSGGNELMELDGVLAWMLHAFGEWFAQPGHTVYGGGFGRDTGWINSAADPVHGRIRLGAAFDRDPHVLQVAAGGDDDLEQLLGNGCVGWVNGERPDVVLNLTAGPQPLYLYADASADTTLAVLGPGGRWYCNDDAEGRAFNPALEIMDAASGEYAIWLGMFGSGAVAATLSISRIGWQDRL